MAAQTVGGLVARSKIGRPLLVGSLAAVPRIVDFSLRFARTILLSHLLSRTELGICIALAVVLTVGELAGDLGFDRFLISQRRGDDGDLLAATQALLLGRGIAVAAVMFAAAPWISRAMGAPGQAASFRWCAMFVLIGAFANLEIKQAQRDFRYWPEAASILFAQLGAFAVVYPAAKSFGDHRAMIASLLVGSIVYVGCSHMFARRRYRISIRERATLRGALGYGLPLTLNGIGIAANSQLDRAVVGYGLGIEALALYGVTLNLALVPISLLATILDLLAMSLLVRTRTDGGDSANTYLRLVGIFAAAAACYAVFVAATLDILVPFVFGPAYVVPRSIHLLVTIIAWVPLNQGAPTAALLVTGHTRRVMAANLTAGSGILLSLLLLPLMPRVETVLACVLFGRLVSLGVFLLGARTPTTETRGAILKHLAWSFLPVAVAVVGIAVTPPTSLWWRAAIVAAALLVIVARARRGQNRSG